jgi:ABC-type amino acid transport substrate-binding protein
MAESIKALAFSTVEPHSLTVCAYTEFAPFAYMRDGEVVGTDIELLRRFAASETLGVNIIQRDFKDLWLRPGVGECDVACAGIAALPERDLGAQGTWSVPYLTVERSLLIRKTDAERLKSPADFRGQRIVVTPHSTADFDARARYEPLGAEIVPIVPSQHEIVHMLLNREVAAFAEGTVSNQFLVDQYLDAHGRPQLVLADVHATARIETLHFAVRAVDAKLVERLNAFIKLNLEG